MNWIINNWDNAVPILISSISTVISAIAVVVAIYNSVKTQRQLRESKKPQLSMRLDNFGGFLYLSIENTGTVAAKNILISIKSIENNGNNSDLQLDNLFCNTFELYPNETSQGLCAIYGATIVTPDVFPTLNIDVKYSIDSVKKEVMYSRSVTLSRHWDKRVFADVKMDLSKIENSLYTTAKATLRTANYLDGHLLFHFDDVNILSKRNFHDDICDALKEQKEKGVIDRQTTMRESTSPSNTNNKQKPKRE